MNLHTDTNIYINHLQYNTIYYTQAEGKGRKKGKKGKKSDKKGSGQSYRKKKKSIFDIIMGCFGYASGNIALKDPRAMEAVQALDLQMIHLRRLKFRFDKIDIDGSGNALGVFTLTNDTSYNYVNGINTDQPTDTGLQVTSTTMNIPSGSNNELLNAIHHNTNSFGTTNFPFAITSQNNRIVVDVSNAIPGLAGVQTAWGGTGYTIYIPEKKYAQPYLLVNAMLNLIILTPSYLLYWR